MSSVVPGLENSQQPFENGCRFRSGHIKKSYINRYSININRNKISSFQMALAYIYTFELIHGVTHASIYYQFKGSNLDSVGYQNVIYIH